MPAEPVDLSVPRRVHVVGAGGAGMSAIATVLVGMGHHVSGSDLTASPVLDRLARAGVRTHVGHDAAHLAEAELVAISTAVPDDNPEVAAARERGVRVASRAEVLAAVSTLRSTLAVAGTHGKTTTSSMLALMLRAAGEDPSFIIGGDVRDVGGGAHWGAGPHFVVEADESDGTFLALDRHSAIVTNIEPDHLEHYGGFEAMLTAFDRFVVETPGPVVLCGDDPLAAELAGRADRPVLTYGTTEGVRAPMRAVRTDRDGVRWTLEAPGHPPLDLHSPLPGDHNAANASAAALLALASGVTPEAVAAALAGYSGVARRFEVRGDVAGVTFVDDYAHLPTEVRAAVATARDGGYRRVVAVFQPHRYSRTQSLGHGFADSFDGVDLLVLTDVYSAGEAPRAGVDGHLVLDAVLEAHPHTRVVYLPRRDDLVTHVPSLLRSGDVCLSLGAGDLTVLPDEWMRRVATDPAGGGR